MSALVLQLIGPMQSWGTTSRFDQRDTGKEPSKSGVIGLLAAAMGIDRENWEDLEPLTRLTMGVRHDRPGVPKRDFQTAQNIISADRKKIHETGLSSRDYLADAAFLVALEGHDRSVLQKAHEAFLNPKWTLALGRKSYLPAESIWVDGGVVDASVMDVLRQWPWIVSPRKRENPPEKLLVSLESADESGVLRMDQPLSSFAERRFGARYIQSQWVPMPEGVGACT